MPFKRPSPPRAASSSSSRSSQPLPKRLRTSSPLHKTQIKIYIVQAKLEPETISELYSIADNDGIHDAHNTTDANANEGERHLGGIEFELCRRVGDAEVIITAIHMRRRLERHVDWKIAKEKAIVTPRWLLDSAAQGKPCPCGDYAALNDLHDETVHNCPDTDCKQCRSPDPESQGASSSRGASHSTEKQGATEIKEGALTDVDITPFLKSYDSRYACCRASPIVCPNQDLARALDVMRLSRNLEGEERSALSYERAVAAIKAFPDQITANNLDRVTKLPYIGKKLMTMVEEYIDTGHIAESRLLFLLAPLCYTDSPPNATEETLASSRFQCLSLFSTIYGIGPHTARKLYAQGFRTIEDLEVWYGRAEKGCGIDIVKDEGEDEEKVTERSIQLSLTLREDFNEKIPRDEVEEMNRLVMRELDALLSGCTSTIVGGYRRGKPQSNDVDIVITHTDAKHGAKNVKGLCKKLVRRLYERGLVTHVMHLSSFRAHNALKTTQWDSLEKALTVFILPPSSDDKRRVHRRLDLIFAIPEVYWTAVVGWTGSKMFERDLRLWAKEQKGLKFDSAGITRRRDSKAFFPRSEQEVFEVLGLDFIPPALRNADA